MNKAKKRKLIRSGLILGGVSTVGTVVFVSSYIKLQNQNKNEQILFKSSQKQTYVSPEDETQKNATDSISDTLKAKDKTVFIFMNNKIQVDKKEFQTIEGKKLFIDISKIIPYGYQLDTTHYSSANAYSEVEWKQGQENIVYIQKILSSKPTFIKFFDDQNKPLSENIEIHLTADSDATALINQALKTAFPKDYDDYGIRQNDNQIVEGQVNNIIIYKIGEKVNTTITYKIKTDSGDKTILTKTLTTSKLQTINPNNYLPEDYTFDDTLNKGAVSDKVEPGKEYTYYIKKKQKTFYTDILFKTNDNKPVLKVTVTTVDDQEINPNQITSQVPKNYQLVNTIDANYVKNNIKVGQLNVVLVSPVVTFVTTYFEFVDPTKNDQVVVNQFSIKKPKGEQITLDELKNKLPSGYKFSTENQNISLGTLNKINIQKIELEYKTTIILEDYGLKNAIIYNNTFNSKTVDLNSVIYSLDSGSYVYVDQTGKTIDYKTLKVIPNETNTYYVQKVERTTYQYVSNGKIISTYNPQTVNGQLEKYADHVPSGYQLDSSWTQSPLVIGSVNQIFIKPIVKTYSTTISFVSDKNPEVNKEVPINNYPENQIYSLPQYIQQYVPEGYHVIIPEELNHIDFSKSVNVIKIEKTTVVHETNVAFKMPDGQTKVVNIYTNDDDVVNWKQYIPTGYIPTPENENLVLEPGSTNNIIDVQKPEENKPKKPEEPQVSLTSQQINHIIQIGGQTESPSRTLASPGSSLPKIDNPPIVGEEKAQIEAKFNNLQNLIDSNGAITGDELRKIFTEQQNPAWLDVIAQLVNGTYTPPEPGWKDLTADQRRQIFRDQLAAAQRIMASELKAGRVPKFEIEGYNLGINFGYKSDDKNPTYVSIVNANKQRLFSNDEKYNRNPQMIINGTYFGWTKSDVTSQYTSSYNFSDDNNLKVYEYAPEATNVTVKDKSVRLEVLDINTSDPKSVQTALNMFKSGALSGKINGLFLRNISVKDAFHPNGFDLGTFIDAIPTTVEKITFMFDDPRMYGIGHLQYKHLKSVDLVTTANNINDNLGDEIGPGITPPPAWGIDPNAFKGVDNISYDYNVNNSNEWSSNVKTAGAIVFNVIRPDIGDSLDDVKNGFDLALNLRKSWRVFNGNFGDDGWPTKVDLSNVPQIRSLEGINLYGRAFKTIKLASQGTIATIPLKDIAQQQWSTLLYNWGPSTKSKVIFSTDVNTVHLAGTYKDFTDGWVKEIQGLLYGLDNSNKITTIVVDSENVMKIIKESSTGSYLGNMKIRVKTSDDKF